MHAVQPVPAEENEVRKQHDTLEVSTRVNKLLCQFYSQKTLPAVRRAVKSTR